MELLGKGHIDYRFDLLPPQVAQRTLSITLLNACRKKFCCNFFEVVPIILID